VIQQLNQARWALARLVFIFYIGLSVASLVGGFLTAPLMTWFFFGDWRFWRHWPAGLGLLPHALRVIRLMLSDTRGFMFSVPLTSPPRTTPDPAVTRLQAFWPHGASCGDCSNCCRPGGYACPLLDQAAGLCRGYDSFYWRYFNWGRFPSGAPEIDYYDCRKWHLSPEDLHIDQPEPVLGVPFLQAGWNLVAEQRQETGSGPDGEQSSSCISLPTCRPGFTAAPPDVDVDGESGSRVAARSDLARSSSSSPRFAQTP